MNSVPSASMFTRSPFALLGAHLGVLTVAACLWLASCLAALAIPWAIKTTIDGVDNMVTFWDAARWPVIILVLATVRALGRGGGQIILMNMARQIAYRVRAAMFPRMCQADSVFYGKHRIGDLMSRHMVDVAKVANMFDTGLNGIFFATFALAITVPMLVWLNPAVAVAGILPYFLVGIFARALFRGIYMRNLEVQRAMGAVAASVQEDLTGLQEIRLHNVEQARTRTFAQRSANWLRQDVRLATWRAAISPLGGIGGAASLIAVLWMGGVRVIDRQMTVGELIAIYLYVTELVTPTMSLANVLAVWQACKAAWARAIVVGNVISPLEVDLSTTQSSPSVAPEIEFKDLSVTIDGTSILGEISCRISAGSLCALVGKVASGKTVFVETIARLVDVPAGKLFFDGNDITESSVEQIRSMVAYTPQTAFLFSASVKDNIAYGLPHGCSLSAEERDARILQIADVAGLAPEIADFPNGLDTLVGEGGLSLSGGQRQRIALARALIADRPVLLLDDSLSAVDADTERTILKGLATATKGRTVVLVSHRLSALQHSDQVIVLDRGKIAETGTHEQLLARADSQYSSLYRRQSLMEDEL